MLDNLALAYSKSEHEDPIKVIAHKIDRWTIVVTSMFFELTVWAAAAAAGNKKT